ncbi:hypothetical protein OBBRIDRAFT_812807 [Obba rivulosa]|uniref:Uncharacterized protein n=1 Tax=Obba rivulosa TaxID=1052685 RepID=A0A8E2DNL2_9APHY|nr:hypothetical protein OBBRIDRAFT_812807 [Obba rivulosa]
MDTSSPLPLPRLRLSRHSPPYRTLPPVAGSSRIPLETNNHDTTDEEEDAEATPRIGSASIAPDPSRTSNFSTRPSDAAARLRALMQSTNNASSSRTSTAPAPDPAPTPPSDYESDFEPPYSNANNTTHSVARESLKDLFAHALRDPGDTPRKIGPRRNSIDLSEVEDSPRIEQMEKERAKNKGKRKSLSDEEADSSSSTCYAIDNPEICPTQIRMVMDLTMPPEESSGDTETFEPKVEASTSAAPEPNITQINTLRMSTAQFHMQSSELS